VQSSRTGGHFLTEPDVRPAETVGASYLDLIAKTNTGTADKREAQPEMGLTESLKKLLKPREMVTVRGIRTEV
jgi:hypothetical protein